MKTQKDPSTNPFLVLDTFFVCVTPNSFPEVMFSSCQQRVHAILYILLLNITLNTHPCQGIPCQPKENTP